MTGTRRPARYEFATARYRFESERGECVGRLTTPDRPREPPVVVLAPDAGLGREVYDGLAEWLAVRGYAVFAFDYANWGASREPGETTVPAVDPEGQAEDLAAAVDRVARLAEVDGSRLAVWGHGLGGAHALAVTAANRRVGAVLSRMPAVDGGELPTDALRPRLRGTGLALADRLLSVVGRGRTVAVAGPAEGTALVAADGAERAIRGVLPAGSAWSNETRARSLSAVRGYDVRDEAISISRPALLLAGTTDAVVDPDHVEGVAAEIPDATFVRAPAGHYDLADGADGGALAHELAFLDSRL